MRIRLLLIAALFFGSCVKTFNEKRTPPAGSCKSDDSGQYGSCAQFGGEYLAGKIWTVRDAKGATVFQELVFMPTGEVFVCKTGDCNHDDEHKDEHTYNYRLKEAKITFYNAFIPAKLEYTAEFLERQDDGKLVFKPSDDAKHYFQGY